MNKTGFTLIELLTVIVVLIIILLIVVPSIITLIGDARKGALESTAKGLLKTVENEYMLDKLKKNETDDIIEFIFIDGELQDGKNLDHTGEPPKNGHIILHPDGSIDIVIDDGNWCVKKIGAEKFSVVEYLEEDCKIDGSTDITHNGAIKSLTSTTGNYFNLTLLSTGNVISWWRNYSISNTYGQFGTGNFSPVTEATQVVDLENVIDIQIGQEFAIALLSDGTLKSWGRNTAGQLGLGNYNDVATPTLIPGISNVEKIVVGGWHVLALTSDGNIYSWGYGEEGQLGLGNENSYHTPQLISSLSGVRDISVSYPSVSAAVLNNGEVYTWGSWEVSPIQVSSITNAISIDAGEAHFVVKLDDNSLVTWGSNGAGELGYDPYDWQAPGIIHQLNIDNVDKYFAGRDNTFVIKSDGTLWGIGSNLQDQLGVSPAIGNYTIEFLQIPVSNAVDVHSSGEGTHATLADGTVVSWGYYSAEKRTNNFE